MANLSNSCGLLKPENITASSTTNRREFWAAESERIGTNWRSLISLLFEIVERLRASSSSCATCGGTTCLNPDVCALCRDADDRKARDAASRSVDPSLWRRIPEHIPHNWDEMSLEALMAHFERARRGHGAPQTTVEALMFAMRSGAKALSEPSNQRRLKELSEAQLHEVCARLQKFKSNIARAWTQAEIEGLVTIWAELKNG
jgi:hypothetical protein